MLLCALLVTNVALAAHAETALEIRTSKEPAPATRCASTCVGLCPLGKQYFYCYW